MKKNLAMAVASLAVGMATAAPKVLQPADYTVHVYVDMQSVLLEGKFFAAEVYASQIFAPAGVRLVWHHGLAPEAGPDVLQMKVITSAPAEYRTPEKASIMANATPYAADGTRIVIFADRVRDLASPYGVRGSIIMGHVLAHELGHVMEGIARHSSAGLMKAFWSPADLASMTRSNMAFDEMDVSLVRAGLNASAREFAGR